AFGLMYFDPATGAGAVLLMNSAPSSQRDERVLARALEELIQVGSGR
ncbi:MAG: hypothetical protein ACI9MC_003778, partial [Kiritimatiellia bacterium]